MTKTICPRHKAMQPWCSVCVAAVEAYRAKKALRLRRLHACNADRRRLGGSARGLAEMRRGDRDARELLGSTLGQPWR